MINDVADDIFLVDLFYQFNKAEREPKMLILIIL